MLHVAIHLRRSPARGDSTQFGLCLWGALMLDPKSVKLASLERALSFQIAIYLQRLALLQEVWHLLWHA